MGRVGEEGSAPAAGALGTATSLFSSLTGSREFVEFGQDSSHELVHRQLSGASQGLCYNMNSVTTG